MTTACQSCGNKIIAAKNMGFNKDGSLNKNFCSHCYKKGKLITEQNYSVYSDTQNTANLYNMINITCEN